MELPKRKNIRLKDYDYSSSGAYFITICTQNRRNFFGDVVGAIINRLSLSKCGYVAENAIKGISNHYDGVAVDKYVVMPNHIHMIIFLNNHDKNGRLVIAPTISTVIQQMKRHVSKQIGYPIWQKSYHDHIIRDEADYLRIWQYIDENPAKWAEDEYYCTQ